jgi:hypothetical protein
MVTNSFGSKRRSEGKGFFCFFLVPNMFPRGSQGLPNTFVIAPQIYPMWFANLKLYTTKMHFVVEYYLWIF